jgi:hypothetical protein
MPFIIAYVILFACGELTSINDVVEHQTHNDQMLFGLAYSNPAVSYKLSATIKRKPEVLALGTSRVMPFRNVYFTSPASFYNAGGGVEQLIHFSHFLSKIPAKDQPKILIIGLDQYFFNDQWVNNNTKLNELYLQNLNRQTDILNLSNTELVRVLKDVLLRKIPTNSILNHGSNVGINAIVKGDGFIKDGSYHYGTISSNPDDPKHHDYHYTDTISRIEKGVSRFEYGEKVSKQSLEQLKALLSYCDKRKIHVIGFLPPYANSIYKKMLQKGDKYNYLLKIPGEIEGEFQKYGYSFFDFSDLKSTGAGDIETTDGFHGSEAAYSRILNLMGAKDSYLRKYLRSQTPGMDNTHEH